MSLNLENIIFLQLQTKSAYDDICRAIEKIRNFNQKNIPKKIYKKAERIFSDLDHVTTLYHNLSFDIDELRGKTEKQKVTNE